MNMEELELKEAFRVILSGEKFSDHVCAIVELIYTDELDKLGLEKILLEFKISGIEKIKKEILDLLIMYVTIILKDFNISDKEQKNMILLKKFFRIKEGDFYQYRYKEIKLIITQQLEIIYKDNNVDTTEAIYKVNLQGLFDLSYDQFLEFTDGEIKQALIRGADIRNLDTVKYPRGYKEF